jgi:hypothetical protein
MAAPTPQAAGGLLTVGPDVAELCFYIDITPVTGKNMLFLRPKSAPSVGRKINTRYTTYFTIPFHCFRMHC